MLSMLQTTHQDRALAEEMLVEHLDTQFQRLFQEGDELGTAEDAQSGRSALCAREEALREVMMLTSAYLVEAEQVNPRLLCNLVWVPEKSFTKHTLQLCIQSWNWVLVAREQLQIPVGARRGCSVFSSCKRCPAASCGSPRRVRACSRGRTSSSRRSP